MTRKKRIQISLTEEQIQLLRNFQGELGNSISEIITNIVISWLSEKSFISSSVKRKYFGNNKPSITEVDFKNE